MRLRFWYRFVAVATLAALLLIRSVAAPAHVVHAQTGPTDDIVVLETLFGGRVRVDSVINGVLQQVWHSGGETGFTRVANGNFNSDWNQEIVAARPGTSTGIGIIDVFDPDLPIGTAPNIVTGIPVNTAVHLLTAGDFDRDGRDEIAFAFGSLGGSDDNVAVFDRNATGAWELRFIEGPTGARWTDLQAGDVNGDGHDDLIGIRAVNTDPGENRVKIWSGTNYGVMFESADYHVDFDWKALASGPISGDGVGDDMVLTRLVTTFDLGSKSELLWAFDVDHVNDWTPPNPWAQHFPPFTSVATGDINGDGDHELAFLRDPVGTTNAIGLLVRNPSNAAVLESDIAPGGQYRLVRMGDVDGDAKDEIVLIASSGYRIYLSPEFGQQFGDVGGFFGVPDAWNNEPTLAVANVHHPIPAGLTARAYLPLAIR